MLKPNEFKKWVLAYHDLYEIFEGRYDAYPLTKRWVQEWLTSGTFEVTISQMSRINDLIDNFNYKIHKIKDRLKEKMHKQIKETLNKLKIGKNQNLGFAITPYLFTWNIKRFKKYFIKPSFDLIEYSNELGNFLEDMREKLIKFRYKRLLDDHVNEARIKEIFEEINNNLREIGIKQNEPISTIKIIHVTASRYFPLIDNNIAKTVGLIVEGESIVSNSYIKWMKSLKKWLEKYREIIKVIEGKFHGNYSILKLVDEGLYMMCTVNQQTRVVNLGIEIVEDSFKDNEVNI